MTNTPSNAGEFDVGILGWWYGKNYGSILTYYGLNRAVENLGYKALMVHEPLGYNGYRVKWPKDILSMKFADRVGYSYTDQIHYSELSQLNAKVDTFLLGSDQLWNPLIGRVNGDLFLDFAADDKRRVAYATSFGNRNNKKFKPDFIAKHRPNLQQFTAISVREKYAINTARDVFNVDATQTVDPVFLLEREHYEALADRATVRQSGEYLAVFYLDPDPDKKATVRTVAKKLGFKKILIIPNPDEGRAKTEELFHEPEFDILAEDAPENFLEAYRKASYVITDSFHGTAFAVIFQKPFSSIYNTKRGIDRFKSLLGALGFDERRRIYAGDSQDKVDANKFISRKINFTAANRYLTEGRQQSLTWLKTALSAPAQHKVKAVAAKTVHAAGQAAGQITAPKAAVIAPPRPIEPNTDGVFGHHTGALGQTAALPEQRLRFQSNSPAWKIVNLPRGTLLGLPKRGAAVRGNHIFCDLPQKLHKGAAYRLIIRWRLRTRGTAVNLHIRNPKTERFQVIGSAAVRDTKASWRIDTFDFVAKFADCSQFMLGAVHFGGRLAGALIDTISLQELTTEDITGLPLSTGSGPAQVSKSLALDDHARFAASLAQNSSAKNKKGARARIMFHAHAIEKGLSHSNFRAGFGKISVPALAREMNGWLKHGRDPQDIFFQTGAAVMQSYHRRHESLKSDISHFWSQFSPKVQDYILHADSRTGGVMEAAAPREDQRTSSDSRSFLDVVNGRRSVREFTNTPVTDAQIEAAVQIAMQAPSVCNRQGARVHQFDDPKAIKAALNIQGGFGGYKMPPRLLLVTVDLNAFLFAAERNQPYVDGGLFMMTLLLGLEEVGLAGCSLNTAMNTERAGKIRKLLNIPANEVFISFIAVGHYDSDVLTPRSKRISMGEVLKRHGQEKKLTPAR